MATIFMAFLASDVCYLVTRLVLSRFLHVPPVHTAINTLWSLTTIKVAKGLNSILVKKDRSYIIIDFATLRPTS